MTTHHDHTASTDAHAHGDHSHQHEPGCSHSHHDHDAHHHAGHAPTGGWMSSLRSLSPERRTLIALAVTFAFMLVEVAGGLISGSLALLADAAHMLADVLALALTWGAFRFGRMVADGRRSYGYRRLEVMAAWINGLTVLGLSIGIVIEAILRLIHPEPVQSTAMLAVAIAGFIANLLTFLVLGGHAHHGHDDHDHAGHDHDHNLNMRGAILHVLGDLLGSVAAIAAAIVIGISGWLPIDPILSIVLSLLIVAGGWRLVLKSTNILLEGTPEGFSAEKLRTALLDRLPNLMAVHHIHAWSVGSGQPMLTLHAVAAQDADRDALLSGIKSIADRDFGLPHSVVQIEGVGCGDEGESCGESHGCAGAS